MIVCFSVCLESVISRPVTMWTRKLQSVALQRTCDEGFLNGEGSIGLDSSNNIKRMIVVVFQLEYEMFFFFGQYWNMKC